MAYVYGQDGDYIPYSWHHSMVELLGYDLANRGRVMAGGYIAIRCGTNGLIESRNNAARDFLKEGRADWLFWVDTDMGFAPDTIDRLLEAADPDERPIVGALCFSQRADESDGMGGWKTLPTPTIFDWAHVGRQSGFAVRWDYPPNSVVKCAGTGSAAILIHRRVFEQIEQRFGPRWYHQVPNTSTGQMISEDLSFCVRAGSLGIPIHVHTGVKTTHAKRIWMSEEDYWRMRAFDPPTAAAAHAGLPMHIDLPASLKTLEDDAHVQPGGMLKLDADLDRYRQLIGDACPQVIVETGTFKGASAAWFAGFGVDVITVDVAAATTGTAPDGVTWIHGDSADPDIAAKVAELVAGRRCMVVLDSDHSAAHVAKEIGLYGPLVSPGCYLVVEDTIFGYAPARLRGRHFPAGLDGSPLDAVAQLLHGHPAWSRDVAVERLSPLSHHPSGFWLRNEAANE